MTADEIDQASALRLAWLSWSAIGRELRRDGASVRRAVLAVHPELRFPRARRAVQLRGQGYSYVQIAAQLHFYDAKEARISVRTYLEREQRGTR